MNELDVPPARKSEPPPVGAKSILGWPGD